MGFVDNITINSRVLVCGQFSVRPERYRALSPGAGAGGCKEKGTGPVMMDNPMPWTVVSLLR